MKIVIDTDTGKLMVAGPQGVKELPLSSPAGAEFLSQLTQSIRTTPGESRFTWGGQPVEEPPEALFRLQEAIVRVRPQRIVSSGKMSAGALLFLAGVLRDQGGERMLVVDADIAPDERLSASTIHFAADESAALDLIPLNPDTHSPTLALFGSTSGQSELRDKLERYAARLSMGSAILSMELLTLGELQAKHAAEALAEFAMEHPEYHGEFLPSATGSGLVPLLRRMK